jgi:hypothetical protein
VPRAPFSLADVTDCCLAATVGLAVLVVWDIHYLLSQPYWLDEAWVADSVRAPLALVPRLSVSTPLGWVLLLRLVPAGGPERQRLIPLAFAGLAAAAGYLLGRELRLTPFAAGILTGAAVLLSPAMLARGDLKQYTAEAFSAVLLWLLVARLENAWSRRRLAAVAVTASAGCLFATTAILTGAAAFAALGLECLLRRQWRRLAEAAVAAAGMLAIFGVVYLVVLRPRITPGLAYYWKPKYLPGSQPNALDFLRVQFHDLSPVLGLFSTRPAAAVTSLALAAGGVFALARLRRPALAAMLPLTIALVIAASAASAYPFGDQRTSTFWLVMVPVLMAIAIAAVIHAATRQWGRWPRWMAALAATAVALAGWVTANGGYARSQAINPENPYAQVMFVQAHARQGDVILVNVEASFGFAYYYKAPPGAYPAVSTIATEFVPQYPGKPRIIIATGRDKRAVAYAGLLAGAAIAAEPPGHRGRIWLITDHLGSAERSLWQQDLPAGKVTTLALSHEPHASEPLIVDQPSQRSIP